MFGPPGSAFEGHGSPLPVNTFMCIHIEFKDDICADYFQKVQSNSPPHGLSQIKKNVPELETRKFGRLRLRLSLLARCHDSGQLRLRLRTPDFDLAISRL